jgi:predicted O-methyltransferase YrrM
MNSSFLRRTASALAGFLRKPRSSISWVRRGHLAKDSVFISQTYWFRGVLPRVPLAQVLPTSKQVELCLPAAFDRKFGTSITVEEACHLCAIAKCVKAHKILEIGTFDGNTTLALAANLVGKGGVVTVDLPPDFDLAKDQGKLTYADGEINITARDQLGRQYRDHPLSSRIEQVFGDSASLDWTRLGGPFELIFIDGCHTEEYVWSDTQNALKVLTARGAIVWHDYGMIPEVSNVVDRIAREVTGLKVRALEGTRLAVALT